MSKEYAAAIYGIKAGLSEVPLPFYHSKSSRISKSVLTIVMAMTDVLDIIHRLTLKIPQFFGGWICVSLWVERQELTWIALQVPRLRLALCNRHILVPTEDVG
jgi:hypothetical protein